MERQDNCSHTLLISLLKSMPASEQSVITVSWLLLTIYIDELLKSQDFYKEINKCSDDSELILASTLIILIYIFPIIYGH